MKAEIMTEIIGYIIIVALFAWFVWSCAEVATNGIILSPFNFWNIFKLY